MTGQGFPEASTQEKRKLSARRPGGQDRNDAKLPRSGHERDMLLLFTALNTIPTLVLRAVECEVSC